MRRSTDRLIALQFLAVAVPIAFVLLAQMAADARRAAALEHSRPLRTLANEARASYRTFTNGAADAVGTGALGRQSAEALNTTGALLGAAAAGPRNHLDPLRHGDARRRRRRVRGARERSHRVVERHHERAVRTVVADVSSDIERLARADSPRRPRGRPGRDGHGDA